MQRIVKDYICDRCGSDVGVKRWRVVQMGAAKQVSLDLCKEHSIVLEDLLALVPGGKRGQLRKRQVKTEAQVKALRGKAPRKTAKKTVSK